VQLEVGNLVDSLSSLNSHYLNLIDVFPQGRAQYLPPIHREEQWRLKKIMKSLSHLHQDKKIKTLPSIISTVSNPMQLDQAK
jgi:hypothetical protein